MPRVTVDLTGERFGRLVVTGRMPSIAPRFLTTWFCRCDCGNYLSVLAYALTQRGRGTKSCGCLQQDRAAEAQLKHGHALRPAVTPEYRTWCAMKARCFRKTSQDYKDYGGRGITVCDAWRNDFEQFFRDMGPRPKGCSIGRINNDGNYEPGNCRWETMTQQHRNMRKVLLDQAKVMRCREMRARGALLREIAAATDSTISAVHGVLQGKTWKNV